MFSGGPRNPGQASASGKPGAVQCELWSAIRGFATGKRHPFRADGASQDGIGFANLARCLELDLHNGRCPTSGDQIERGAANARNYSGNIINMKVNPDIFNNEKPGMLIDIIKISPDLGDFQMHFTATARQTSSTREKIPNHTATSWSGSQALAHNVLSSRRERRNIGSTEPSIAQGRGKSRTQS